MAGFTDYLEDKVLDHVFGGTAYTAPSTLYVALFTVSPGDDGTGGTEVSGGAYARQTATFTVSGSQQQLNTQLQPQIMAQLLLVEFMMQAHLEIFWLMQTSLHQKL